MINLRVTFTKCDGRSDTVSESEAGAVSARLLHDALLAVLRHVSRHQLHRPRRTRQEADHVPYVVGGRHVPCLEEQFVRVYPAVLCWLLGVSDLMI